MVVEVVVGYGDPVARADDVELAVLEHEVLSAIRSKTVLMKHMDVRKSPAPTPH